MDRIRVSMLILVLVTFSAACMSETEPDEGEKENPSEPPQEQDEPDESEPEETLSAEEVLQQSINKMEDLNNYTIDTNMNQHIQLNEKDALKNRYRSSTAVNLDPVQYHESSTIAKSETDQTGENTSLISLERYFTEEGFFIFDSTEGRWTKFPEQFTQDFQSYDKSFEKPEHILEMIETYNNDIEIVEGERHYQLTFSGDNDQTQQIALQIIGMVNTDFSASMEDMLYMTEIANLEYKLQIDKETFYAKKLKMDLTLNMNSEEGETYQSRHMVVAHYSNLDETEAVTVPSNVIDHADEMEFDEFNGFDEMEEFDTIEGIEMDELYEDNESESEENSNFDLSEYLNGNDEEKEEDGDETETTDSDEPK